MFLSLRRASRYPVQSASTLRRPVTDDAIQRTFRPFTDDATAIKTRPELPQSFTHDTLLRNKKVLIANRGEIRNYYLSTTMDAMLHGKPCSLVKTNTRVVELTSALSVRRSGSSKGKSSFIQKRYHLLGCPDPCSFVTFHHPGELYHKGIDITYGVRCLLVCFTDGMNPKILDDSRQEDDDPKFEANVLVC
ncbi:hypothetical protein ACHAWT_008842 [Skeletonema menzelii]